MSILIVDDEHDIRESLQTYLKSSGYDVRTACNGAEAWEMLGDYRPELIIADIVMPKMDGLKLCGKVKNKNEMSDIPIIMLTAKADEIDVVLGLECGADDYITKPFSMRELLARVKSVLRRVTITEGKVDNIITHGKIMINCVEREVRYNGEKFFLTNKEFDLFRFFASHPGEVFSRDEIVAEIWGKSYSGDHRVVDLQVKNLRKKIKNTMKIENEKQAFELIKSVRGRGYLFSPDVCG